MSRYCPTRPGLSKLPGWRRQVRGPAADMQAHRQSDRKPMNRILAAGTVLLVAAILLTGMSPLLVSPQRVRNAAVQQVRELTGLQLDFSGEPEISFRPFLGVTLRNARIGAAEGGDAPLLQTDAIRMRIPVAAALTGAIDLRDVVLDRPRLRLVNGADGAGNWKLRAGRLRDLIDRAAAGRSAQANGTGLAAEAPAAIRLGAISIVDGSIERLGAEPFTLTGIDAAAAWPESGGPLTAAGEWDWHGQRFAFDWRIGQPVALASGGVSKAGGSVTSQALRLEFRGDINLVADLHFAGKVVARSDSAEAVARLLATGDSAGATPLPVSISGTLDGMARNFELRDAAIAIGDQQARGALRFSAEPGKRPQVNATLAFPKVALPPLSGEAVGAALTMSGGMDADLRLSAPSLSIGRFSASDVAAAVTVRNGVTKIDIGNAGFLDGALAAKLSIAQSGGDMKLDGKAELSGFSLASAFAAAQPGGLSVSGKAKAQGTIRSSGRSYRDLLDSLQVAAALQVGAGSLGGIDLSPAATKETQNAGGRIAAGGATPFVSLVAEIEADRRRMWIEQAVLKGEGLIARLSGSAHPGSGGLAIRIRSDEDQRSGAGGLFVGGTLDQPVITRLPRGGD
jgi:uncharacterized protein involved in outer membrane biogenesis